MPDKSKPSKPAGGTLLCLTNAQNIAYRATNDGEFQQFFIDSGATGHYVNDADSLCDYVTFNVAWEIKTAEAGCLSALGSGTLKFTAVINGNQMAGELKDVCYIPGIDTQLISLGKLFSQGWEPRLS